jgi:hypothetical protein
LRISLTVRRVAPPDLAKARYRNSHEPMLALFSAAVTFVPPTTRLGAVAPKSFVRVPAPVALGGFELPKLPDLPNPFGGGGDFEAKPGDVPRMLTWS